MPLRYLDRITTYHRQSRSITVAALAVAPLVLVYGLGLLVASPRARTGADFLTESLMSRVGLEGYVAFHVGLVLLVVVVVALRSGRATMRRALLALPMAAESTVYALFLSTAIFFVMEEVNLLGPSWLPAGLVDRVVLSAGAGLYEETVFRLVLIPVLALGARRLLAMPRPVAFMVAVALSSLAFAAAHHLAGEPFDVFAFTYRSLAGAAFALLFLARGFGVAVWTHAAYDFYVLGMVG